MIHVPLALPLWLVVGLAFSLVAVEAVAEPYPYHVEIRERGFARDVYVVNDGPAPLNVVIELTSVTNMGFNPLTIGSRFSHYVPPKSTRFVTTGAPLKGNTPGQWTYRTRYSFGQPDSEIDLKGVYRLPIANGTRGVIRAFSRIVEGDLVAQTANAVEVLVPPDTNVVASKEGTVIEVLGDAVDGDLTERQALGNRIAVLHADGTWALYGWLKPSSMLVRIGDQVQAGQVIAKSWRPPNATDTYVHLSLLFTFSGAQVRSSPISFVDAAHQKPFTVRTYTGPVSPDLPPRYPTDIVSDIPLVPVDQEKRPQVHLTEAEQRLNPRQRAEIYQERMLQATGNGATQLLTPGLGFVLARAFAGLTLLALIYALASSAARNNPGGGVAKALRRLRLEPPEAVAVLEGSSNDDAPRRRVVSRGVPYIPHSQPGCPMVPTVLDVAPPGAKSFEEVMKAHRMSRTPSAVTDSPEQQVVEEFLSIDDLLQKLLGTGFHVSRDVPLFLLVPASALIHETDPHVAPYAVFRTGAPSPICLIEPASAPVNWSKSLRTDLSLRGLRVVQLPTSATLEVGAKLLGIELPEPSSA